MYEGTLSEFLREIERIALRLKGTHGTIMSGHLKYLRFLWRAINEIRHGEGPPLTVERVDKWCDSIQRHRDTLDAWTNSAEGLYDADLLNLHGKIATLADSIAVHGLDAEQSVGTLMSRGMQRVVDEQFRTFCRST